MKDMRIAIDESLSGLDEDGWLANLEHLADEHGYFEPLGDTHSAAFFDAGTKLFVSFENADTIRKQSPKAEPMGFRFVRKDGWSHLIIVSNDESWFRDIAVYRYFDRLIDDGFFEDFDKVLFHGIGPCGYAAAAYSVAAPGATVLAIRPQATLDADITGFDRRFLQQRSKDWTTRYGYAPDMVDAAEQAFIIFDPFTTHDATHAALFKRPNVTPLKFLGTSTKPELTLNRIGAHVKVVAAAMEGTLSQKLFSKLIRHRAKDEHYKRSLFMHAVRRQHHVLAANIAAYVLRQGPNKFFAKRLEGLQNDGHFPTRPVKSKVATT